MDGDVRFLSSSVLAGWLGTGGFGCDTAYSWIYEEMSLVSLDLMSVVALALGRRKPAAVGLSTSD